MEGIGSAGRAYGPQGPERLRENERPAPSRDPGATGRGGEVERQPAPAPAPPAVQEAEPLPGDSVAMPEGVEPELWNLLTTEERAHFARFAAMGGVTYGPETSSSNRPLIRGQRLDVRI